jgi:hypothetical protein
MNTPLNAHEVFIAQIPNKDNGFHAVCTTRIVSPEGRSFAAIGEAVGEDEGSDQSLLQRAGQNGYDRAVELMRQHARSNYAIEAETRPSWKPTPAKSKRFVGGPITDKQKRFIETTAMHNGKTLEDAEAISQELFGRSITELTTKDANPILEKLKM